mmetsp:Transcript_59360/g.168807  ORF Transcript_59360/g.168807 Transcript_59360/m.168807 type:complete len:852 (+) Transcript_59360:415-2970(+)
MACPRAVNGLHRFAPRPQCLGRSSSVPSGSLPSASATAAGLPATKLSASCPLHRPPRLPQRSPSHPHRIPPHRPRQHPPNDGNDGNDDERPAGGWGPAATSALRPSLRRRPRSRPRRRPRPRPTRRHGALRAARAYITSRYTVPWLPTVVTHPMAPSDLTLHFIRMSPDFSSLRAHSRTSTTSPSLSFRVVSLSLRVFSLELPASSSKDSVRMVSFTTLKMCPPSSRNAVPCVPESVTQPSISSFMTVTRTRSTSTVSSLVGPSRISTISPGSSRRSVLPSLMLMAVVMTVSFETFMKVRMRFTNLSLLTKPSSSSSREPKTLASSSSVGAAASSTSSSLASPSSVLASFSPLAFGGSSSHFLQKAVNSASSILSSLLASIAAKSSSFFSLCVRWWYLTMLSTRVSSAYSSLASFLLASSRNLAQMPVAFARRVSWFAIFCSSLLTSTAIHSCSPVSTPSERSMISDLAFMTSSRESLMASSTPSASFIISADPMSLPCSSRGPACSSALSTCSPAAVTALSAPFTFSCSSAFASASFLSFSSLATLRSWSLAFSRAMPMAALSLWNFSIFTPFSPSPTWTLNQASTVALGTTKSNSALAYFRTSLRLSMPSLSRSYLSNTALITSAFLRASAFIAALSLALRQARKMDSLVRVHSLILWSSFVRLSLLSEGGCPGVSMVFMSWPRERMKSVQTFILSLASWPASSTALAVAVTSSSASSLALGSEKGSASSPSILPAASATSTYFSSSFNSSSARSWASLRCLSISTRCSSTLLCCSMICSILSFACSRPWSASNFRRSFWPPQFSSSFCRTSASSCRSSSRFPGAAERTTFWMTLRIASVARCSSRCLR